MKSILPELQRGRKGREVEKEAATTMSRRSSFVAAGVFLSAFLARPRIVEAQDKTGFPDGYDAVQAAPNSHKVIFENALVRVLQVTVPPPGATEPMHHHRWPSFFLAWDTGGKTPHVHYLRPDGSVRDEPSVNEPVHPGRWNIGWMKPEPMHAIQVVDRPEKAPTDPPLLRVEIKCAGYDEGRN
jgi:hypothetical protein